MALFSCTDCGHQVSTKAAACPHCGNPVLGIQSARASPGPANTLPPTPPATRESAGPNKTAKLILRIAFWSLFLLCASCCLFSAIVGPGIQHVDHRGPGAPGMPQQENVPGWVKEERAIKQMHREARKNMSEAEAVLDRAVEEAAREQRRRDRIDAARDRSGK